MITRLPSERHQPPQALRQALIALLVICACALLVARADAAPAATTPLGAAIHDYDRTAPNAKGGLASATRRSVPVAARAPRNGTRRPVDARQRGFLAAKAGEEGLEGISRSYVDITKGRSIRNVGTGATHTEFVDSLSNGGWIARTSKDGKVQTFSKDGARDVLPEGADSYDGWSADFYSRGSSKITLKIRLGYK